MPNRLIPTTKIPKSLWNNKLKKLKLPELLLQPWLHIISRESLEALAKERAPKGFEGGVSKIDTDRHLAWRYTGSCARVLLSILGPNKELSTIADTYASIFSGGKVLLIDIPSGSGAAAISVLSALYELRKHNVLPRLPLEIFVLSGEISDFARSYNDEQLAHLIPLLEEQAIWIKRESLCWDVTCKLSTADLTKKAILIGDEYPNKLLLLSNFSGFLEHSGKWKEAQQQIESIFLHSRDINSYAVWLEPQRKTVPRFIQRLVGFFNKAFGALFGNDSSDTSSTSHAYGTAQSKCQHPLKEHVFDVRLTVVRFELPVSKKS